MNWIQDIFEIKKPIIAMCHIEALPGDPGYNAEKGIDWIIERAKEDLQALQEGGVDGVMFSNEFSLPYLTKTEPITAITLARIIGELKSWIKVPYGVNVLWDPTATIELAAATGAQFVREVFSGVYASDFGLWNTNYGEVARRRTQLYADNVKLLFNIVPEAAKYLSNRDLAEIAKTTIFNHKPNALCVSGITAGAATSTETLRAVRDAVGDFPVFANTGVRKETLAQIIPFVDGTVTATTFKVDGIFENPVSQKRVVDFMKEAKKLR